MDKLMKTERSRPARWDEGSVFWGFILGLLGGAIVALLKLPRSGMGNLRQLTSLGQNLRESMTPTDSVAESLAEGKAVARRRYTDLNADSRS